MGAGAVTGGTFRVLLLKQGSASAFGKGQIVNIAGFGGHTVFSPTADRPHCHRKVALDDTYAFQVS